MALGSALIHKARTIRKVRSETRTEGGYRKATEFGPWFRCFYDPGAESETRDGGTTRYQKPASLLVGRRDITGQPVKLLASDEVEIQVASTEEALRMQIQGTPRILRKRRTVLGFEAQLSAVSRK